MRSLPILLAAPGLALALVFTSHAHHQASPPALSFALVQPELFSASGGQPNAWADMDGDGDLDLFVGFRGRANRLYRNDEGRFTDVAAEAGVADTGDTRAAAWGDFDADGDPDLYVGFADGKTLARIYRNDGGRFTDVASALGIALAGVSRQPAWVDVDGDGDLDLFTAFRDRPNRLFRNDGTRFVDISSSSGIDDPRKTVGGVWWDADEDGDLDVFVANQDGDANGLFRNDAGRFVDVAGAVGVAAAGRPKDEGGVGPAVADVDLDGRFDLFVANYGPSALYMRRLDGTFREEARARGIDLPGHVTTAAFGDVDADGWPDLYLAAYLAGEPHYRDWLFRNVPGPGGARRFEEGLPEVFLTHDGTHGVQFVDFDGDGALDLSLTNNHDPEGGHYLARNTSGVRGLSVLVTDADGRLTRPGAEVRVYAAGTRRLLAAGLVDAGTGYSSQSAGPVFVGVGGATRVDLEVTVPSGGVRRVTRRANVDVAGAPRPLRLATP